MSRPPLDITRDVCPITFVKTKLELEDLAPGAILEVLLRDGEPLKNVSRSLLREGHEVLATEALGDGIHRLTIRRGSEPTVVAPRGIKPR